MSNEGVCLSDEYIDELIQQAISAYRRHQSGARGQMIMPSDGIEWWIVRATWGAATEQAAAALRELESQVSEMTQTATEGAVQMGRLIDRVAELEAENERLEDDAYQLISDDYTLCDCCESLATDAVDAGGHMQCRSCTRIAELEAGRDRLQEALRCEQSEDGRHEWDSDQVCNCCGYSAQHFVERAALVGE